MQWNLAQIEVDCFIRWCTDHSVTNNDDDWRALKITKIMKGEPFKYDFYMNFGNNQQLIDGSKSNICLSEIFVQCASRIFVRANQQCTIVPVPNSSATVSSAQFNTYDHAIVIASLLEGYDASPLLVWSTPQNRAHTGGRRRDYREHLGNLVVNGRTNKPIILYDDVLTTGSQMYASKLKLEQAGMKVIGMVVVTSVLDKDGTTHSDPPGWMTVTRTLV